jgi:hypothetical protein
VTSFGWLKSIFAKRKSLAVENASSTAGGQSVSADDFLPTVTSRGYLAETNLDRGVWIFYPFKPDVECFIDFSSYDEECVFAFSAIFQSAALPKKVDVIIEVLAIERNYAYASGDALIAIREVSVPHGELTPMWFDNAFENWNEEMLSFVHRMASID